MLQPARTKYRKQQKGRIHGNAIRGTEVSFGSFGLKAEGTERITSRQIEAARRALGIVSDSASPDQLLVVIRTIPVETPLPHVARHVVEAVRVCWKFRHGRDAGIAVGPGVFSGEFTLEDIRHPFSAGF